MRTRGRRSPAAGLVAVVGVLLVACGDDAAETARTGPVEVLLDQETLTVLDQQVEYPDTGPAEISSSIVTLEPGSSTGWHRHDAPLYGYVLAGTLEVDYGDAGTRTYATGDALLEAIGTEHNGTAVGDDAVRILVVNLGADGTENTVTDE